MPRERGEAISKARENLTDFGKLFYEICDYLGTTAAEVAVLSELSEALISKNTRFTEEAHTYPPTRKTIVRIYGTFEVIAMERNLLLTYEVKEAFFNADPAMQGTVDQSEKARRIIGQWQNVARQSAKHALANHSPEEDN